MAQFDHHTSRDLDPQLHTHVFIFNLAPRRDGTWGAIVSRDLYRAQKQAGSIYRDELAKDLERAGVEIDRSGEIFRVTAIPIAIEKSFSKRRTAIEKAARTHGYSTPKGMEMAALRTRKSKQIAPREALFTAWRGEAKALGFELAPAQIRTQEPASANAPHGIAGSLPAIPNAALTGGAGRERANSNKGISRPVSPNFLVLLQRLAAHLDGHSRMPGVKISLRERPPVRDHDRDR